MSVPNQWRVTRFRDVLVTGVRNGIYKHAEYHGRGAKIVNMGELFGHPRLRAVPMRRIDVNGSELERFGLNEMDLLFARRSLVAEGAGKCSIVLEVDEPTVFESSIIRARPNVEEADPLFLYYLWSSPVGAHLLDTIRRQVAVSGITGKDLEQLQILLPPPGEQRAIAGVLGALDDKIEQNWRTARGLERLARAIFRAWFVDFEPVKAKAAGATAFPSMPQPVFDALPTRLVDSAIGPVPEGWTLKSLYDTAVFVNGAAFRKAHFCKPTDGFPVVKIAELKNGITEQTKFSNRQDLDPKYRINTGEMLYSWSGSPDTSLDTFLWTKGPAFLNQHIFRILTENNAQRYVVYYLLKHLRQTLVAIARDKQTTGLGHVTVADMRRLIVCWPNKDVLDGFELQVGPVFEGAFALLIENERLAAMRDYLLPKLLSGLVRVKAAP